MAMPGMPEIVKEIQALRSQTSEIKANMERVRNLLVDHFNGRNDRVHGKSSDTSTTTRPSNANPRETSFPTFTMSSPRPSAETPPVADRLGTKIKCESPEEAENSYLDIDKATRAAIAEGRQLFVGNLSLTTSDKDLKAFFGPTKVESTIIPRNLEDGQPGRHGFVTMTTAAYAQSAISELNNQLLCERPMYVRLCKKLPNGQTDSHRPTKRRASEGPSETSKFSPHKKAKTEDLRSRRSPGPNCHTPSEHLTPRNDCNSPAIQFEDISEEVDRRLKKSALRRRRQSQLLEGARKRKRDELDDSESEGSPEDRQGRPTPGMSPPLKKQKQSALQEKRKQSEISYDDAEIPKDASPRSAKLRKAELICQDGKWIFA